MTELLRIFIMRNFSRDFQTLYLLQIFASAVYITQILPEIFSKWPIQNAGREFYNKMKSASYGSLAERSEIGIGPQYLKANCVLLRHHLRHFQSG